MNVRAHVCVCVQMRKRNQSSLLAAILKGSNFREFYFEIHSSTHKQIYVRYIKILQITLQLYVVNG